MKLLILGDSAAAGVGAPTQREGFSGRLVGALSNDFRVDWKLSARTGDAVADVVALLQHAPAEPFDVVVSSVGVNDVTGGTTLKNWIDRQRALIELLRSKSGARHIILSGVPPMHLFPALPQPLRWYLGVRAKRLNRELELVAARDRCCQFVSVDFPLDSAAMAADGFHPGPLAFHVWGDSIADVIRRRIQCEAGRG